MHEYRVWSFPGLAGMLLLASVATEPVADSPPPLRLASEALDGPVSATVERVVDGDTIEVRARIWLGQSLVVRVRIDGVDAPELKARCEDERRRAEQARDFLSRRLEGADVKLSRVAYDKYGGRVRADVADKDGDIAHALLGAGLARPYRGERRRSWCE